jgi:hypothetical protein
MEEQVEMQLNSFVTGTANDEPLPKARLAGFALSIEDFSNSPG